MTVRATSVNRSPNFCSSNLVGRVPAFSFNVGKFVFRLNYYELSKPYNTLQRNHWCTQMFTNPVTNTIQEHFSVQHFDGWAYTCEQN